MKAMGIRSPGRDRQRQHSDRQQIDAAELSPGEFADRVRRTVDFRRSKTVVIDSLNGYQAAMPEENSLILHMHELLQYLNRQGAATFMTVAQHGLVGDMQAPVDVTYLADSVILLRYFESRGKVRRADIGHQEAHRLSTKRRSAEFTISNAGLTMGDPLDRFHGVLRGVPNYAGDQETLDGRQSHVTDDGILSERADHPRTDGTRRRYCRHRFCYEAGFVGGRDPRSGIRCAN